MITVGKKGGGNMERNNRPSKGGIVETRNVSGTGENIVVPAHAFVRLGSAQRVRVDLPMNQKTLRTLAALQAPRKNQSQ